MTDRIKVLNINNDSSEYSGVAIFLLNVFRKINHDRIQYDFLTPDKTPYNSYRDEIENAKCNVFEFNINWKSLKGKVKYGRRLREFLAEHPYDIVHVNSGAVSFDYITTIAAKSQGAKVVIHSHSGGQRPWWKNLLVLFMKCRMQKKADLLCACSTEAALKIYTSKKVRSGEVVIINNGIDIQKFKYNKEIREKIRHEFNINNQLVVGHIGRFSEEKNHTFLIEIFREIHIENPDAVLMLIGQGELEDQIKEKVHCLNLDTQVLFLGQRSDVEELYQAMDIFLFPSLYEGLPISLVEAQDSGLPCCISDVITKEVDLTQLIHCVSLKAPASEWANTLLSIVDNSEQRQSFCQDLMNAGFGIETTAEKISQLYETLV